MTPTINPELVRQHAYELFQQKVNLSLPECQFYEEEIRRWIDEKRAFTAYQVSHTVNGVLIQCGKVGLRYTMTRDAVHAILSLYLDAAGYKSSIEDLGDGRKPWLYYPDEASRMSWLACPVADRFPIAGTGCTGTRGQARPQA